MTGTGVALGGLSSLATMAAAPPVRSGREVHSQGVPSASPTVYTRGVGVYPGDPKDYSGPSMVVDETNYRNLALHRPAYHSSSYDYNLTAQLVTDGIKETKLL